MCLRYFSRIITKHNIITVTPSKSIPFFHGSSHFVLMWMFTGAFNVFMVSAVLLMNWSSQLWMYNRIWHAFLDTWHIRHEQAAWAPLQATGFELTFLFQVLVMIELSLVSQYAPLLLLFSYGHYLPNPFFTFIQ